MQEGCRHSQLQPSGSTAEHQQRRRSEEALDLDESCAAGSAAGEDFKFSGRYVVDLDLLSKSLQCTNTHCKEPLELRMCTKSVKFGLANYLYITCSACGQENQCPTSSTLNGTSGPFAVNVKAAVGMVHAGLSPGSHTASHAEKLERDRKRRRVHQGSKEFKRRRLELKSMRSGEQDAAEVREGLTYSTGWDMSATPLDESSTESIPPFTAEPQLESVQLSTSPPLLVIFDVETTSLSRESELTQLAAVNTETGTSFNEFVLPAGPITPGASSVTGLTTKGRGNGRQLCKHGKPISAVDSATALRKFLDWLLSFKTAVILVAHNCHQFDLSVFLNAVLVANLEESFDKVVAGFTDTLPLLRKALPGKASYALPALFADVVGGQFSAHDAAADTEALMKVSKAAKLDLLDPDGTATLSSGLERTRHKAEKSPRRKTLQKLVDDKVITVGMADKIAASGLAYCHLQLAHRRNSENGLRLLLAEKCPDGKARVTTVSRIHQALADHFASSQDNIASSQDNIANSQDNIASSQDNIASSQDHLATSNVTLFWGLPPPPTSFSLTHNLSLSVIFLPATFTHKGLIVLLIVTKPFL